MVQCVHPAAVSLNDQLDKLAQLRQKCKDPQYHTPISQTTAYTLYIAAQCRSVTGRNERECCMGGYQEHSKPL